MTDLLALRMAAVNLDFRDPERSVWEPYVSCQLASDEDSTRLITIDADLDSDGRISCQLETTTFSSRPRFTALSYRWGDETNQLPVIVNGRVCCVTPNLHDALSYLRVVMPGEKLWVDALVINQDDIPEKNYQVAIMPHIYKRARGIVSWLSKPLGALDKGFMDPDRPDASELRRSICNDEYWHRAWVLQEVGKARTARVCIGPKPVDWDAFIAWISHGLSEPELRRTGPGRFNHLRKNRTKLPMNLKRLIEDYSTNYLCKNPRDKIYSLVGLSTDGGNLPMDYGRPLLGVWSDVVAYLAANGSMPYVNGDTEPFCRALRECLGGESLGCPEGVVTFVPEKEEEESQGEAAENQPADDYVNVESTPADDGKGKAASSTIQLYACTVGTIVCVGPTTAELSSSLGATTLWEEHLHKVFEGCDDKPESVAAEYEPLLDAILDSDDGVPVKTSSNVVPVVDNVINDGIYMLGAEYLLEDGTSPAKHHGLKHTWHHDIAPGLEAGPRLAAFKFRRAGSWTQQANVKIALVPHEAQVGDRMLHVVGSPLKALMCHVFRTSEEKKARLRPYGTAKLAYDFSPDPPMFAFSMEESIRVHPMMAYALMFDDDDRRVLKRE